MCPGPPNNPRFGVHAVFLPGTSASSACTGQMGNNVPSPTPCDPCDCTPCKGGCAPATAPGTSYRPYGKDYNGPGIFCLATPKT